jgi:NAD(P)-dependent dehydrogenase (short-subunit alcohol dehydrogenase family)
VLVHAAAVGRHVALDAASGRVAASARGERDRTGRLTRLCLLPCPRLPRHGDLHRLGGVDAARARQHRYPATKHALKALADGLRLDESAQGVRVSTVAPGQTDTPMLRSGWSGPYAPERFIRPESVARTVRFVVDAGPDVHLTDVAVRPRVELA